MRDLDVRGAREQSYRSQHCLGRKLPGIGIGINRFDNIILKRLLNCLSKIKYFAVEPTASVVLNSCCASF